jgi:hypothetical protein
VGDGAGSEKGFLFSRMVKNRANERMKRWEIFLIGAASIVVLLVALIVVRGVNHQSWMGYTPSQINRIGLAVEWFREEKGFYPKTLSEAVNTQEIGSERSRLEYLIGGKDGNEYLYRPSSNSFVITARRPGGLFSRREEMEKMFTNDVVWRVEDRKK